MDCYLVYIQMNNIYSSFSLKTNIASALSGDADMRLRAHWEIPTRFMPHTVHTKDSCILTVFDNTLCNSQLGMNSYAKSVMTGFMPSLLWQDFYRNGTTRQRVLRNS